MSTISVTLDTNACDVVHDENKKSQQVDPSIARQLRSVIQERKVSAFVSEASLFVECLSFEDKLKYLSVAGTWQPRPTPDQRRTAVFQDLATLDVRLLRAPLIGAEKFIEELGWADDISFTRAERLDRYHRFIEPQPRQQPLIRLGRAELALQGPIPAGRSRRNGNKLEVEMPQDWAVGLRRAWDSGNTTKRKALRRDIAPIISEWCDALILGSHYGYGNTYFCSLDEGGGAGSGSLMHSTNRAALASQGILVLSPAELVDELKNQGIIS